MSAPRENYQKARDVGATLSHAMMMLAGATLLSVVCAAAAIVWRPSPGYFAVTPDLRVMKLPKLSEPFISQQGLLDWTSEVVTQTLALDFRHYHSQLNAVANDYTPNALNQVISALKSSGTLAMIRSQRIVTSAIPTQAPVIVNSGLMNGAYTWRIQFPLLVSYETSGSSGNKQSLIANVLVQRVSTLYNPRGVAIRQLVIQQGTASQ